MGFILWSRYLCYPLAMAQRNFVHEDVHGHVREHRKEEIL